MKFLLKPLFALCLIACSTATHLHAARWDDIDPADFNLERSAIDPEANIEIIFRDVEVAQYFVDWNLKTTHRIYVRMKVFDEVGVERLTRAEFAYEDYQRITKVEARTVKPDGRSVELDPKMVYETELEKSSKGKVKAKAFAFPALEPGDIVEVQLEVKSTNRWDVPFSFGAEYPSRRTSFRIKPADTTSYFRHQLVWFNFPEAEGKSKGGFFSFERFNMPASSQEDYRIPDLHSEPYVVLYYNFEEPPKPGRYWKDTGNRLYRDTNKEYSSSKRVKEKADELTNGASDDLEKLRLLYDFCISQIANRDYDFGAFSSSELDQMKENKSASDTLDRGNGTPADIRNLFGALAGAAGFDARMVAVADKRDVLFAKNLTYPFILNDRLVGIEVNGNWQYFNPGNPHLPFGVVNWWHAGSEVLIANKKGELFHKSPHLPAVESAVTRSGKLTLDENGRLTGKITQTYTGYEAVDLRTDLEENSYDQSKNMIRNRITRNLPQATVENVVFKNARDIYQPMIVTYDLEVPGYAEVAGDRIFVQPAVFQKGREADFQDAGERASSIMFSYPWTEHDELTIILPDGYEMDGGQAPKPFAVDQILSYDASIALGKNKPVAKLTRSFRMEHSLLAPKAQELLQQVFANLKVQDNYTITFKRSAADQAAHN